ncbi:AraC family transcriptional regulator [Microbulbifer thermotolerans]|uniref:AraC family transcriptional regulator n=1 Tax=Microbulbifer thermotolerans TaxID=252514 RepID=A0A143HPA2_MICTH|nr:AraC family transcriptional regulator [Microbulbifer thermotolerans]AMX03327.1 hypothetical protein A3224_12725 [Microbulbifer thermotolerans]MCX2780810.1 AraC family transcriptional regulator [Microbulbifer thermotolerans]MCX2784117.1 AraC family transcriptional regulator [Microbulbifer thermotolerans]MCX2794422.1 AraC family transcriptional regulator [Microbulbifer thermotolerans]MCX2801061.1 AraC family transcriptional regulator [Microbulbifer thermotolerans]
MTQLIQTTSLMGFYDLVNQLNGDADTLLRRFDIEPDKVKALEGVLPYRSTVRLIENTARLLSCADFGLRLARRQDLRALGSLGTEALNASTVGEALETISHNLYQYTGGFQISFDRDDRTGHGCLLFDTNNGCPLPPQSAEWIMGLTQRAMTMLSNARSAPVAVWRSCDVPLHNSYHDFFTAPVIFSRLRDALILSAEQLDRKVVPGVKPGCPGAPRPGDATEATPQQETMDLKHQVEQLIYHLLPVQRCNLQEVANQLGLHKRTLQRRLAEHDIIFEELLDDIRRAHAETYLAEPNIPMIQIAAQLGYREQSSFNRACRRWYGITPLKRRRQLLKKEAGAAPQQAETEADT